MALIHSHINYSFNIYIIVNVLITYFLLYYLKHIFKIFQNSFSLLSVIMFRVCNKL